MERTLHFIASAATVFIATVSACASCDSFPTVEQEFESSALVFVGRVTSVKEVAVRSDSITGGTFYTIEVADVLKGTVGDSVRLYSENSSGRFAMRVSQRYLIFAGYGSFEGIPGRQPAVNNCGNSAPLPKANDTLSTVRGLAKT